MRIWILLQIPTFVPFNFCISMVPNNPNDQIIWDAFREGNKDALKYIYENHHSALKYYGLKFKNDESLISDLIQELFMKLIDSGEKLGQTTNIRFYLLRALRNKIYDQFSKESKNEFTSSGEIDFSIVESIEYQLIKNEQEEKNRAQIIESIESLSKKQQEIIYLRFYNKLSYKEISSVFDTNTQTVQNLMGRAIRALKEDLENKKINKDLILFVLELKI